MAVMPNSGVLVLSARSRTAIVPVVDPGVRSCTMRERPSATPSVANSQRLSLTAGGRTVFLESVPTWAAFARTATPGIDVRDIRYGPWRRFMWPMLRRAPHLLELRDLPADVRNSTWDVILVDAPRGTTWRSPGRMRSVRTAATRAAPGADVFVHDCHRTVERESADQFLGADNLVAQAGTMRHYRPR